MILQGKELDDAVTRVLGNANIPDDHNVGTVALGVTVDQTGAEAAVNVRKTLGGTWVIDGEAFAGHEWSGQNDCGARLIMSGKL